MKKLDAGTGASPSINVRVTAGRKKQLTWLAGQQGVKPSDLVRTAIDEYLKTLPLNVRVGLLDAAKE